MKSIIHNNSNNQNNGINNDKNIKTTTKYFGSNRILINIVFPLCSFLSL